MDTSTQEAPGAPGDATHLTHGVVEADDVLIFPKHKRVVPQYATDASGGTILHLYYDEQDIVFDEPALFAFGETLTTQAHFVAGTATAWGPGYAWPRV